MICCNKKKLKKLDNLPPQDEVSEEVSEELEENHVIYPEEFNPFDYDQYLEEDIKIVKP